MPPKAEVFIAEDDLDWQANYREALTDGGHHVAATATHVDDAVALIPKLKQDGVRIDVAIVDGNMGFSQHGEDGETVVWILRRDYPEAKIIGATFDFRGVRGADLNICKTMDPFALADTVTSL